MIDDLAIGEVGDSRLRLVANDRNPVGRAAVDGCIARGAPLHHRTGWCAISGPSQARLRRWFTGPRPARFQGRGKGHGRSCADRLAAASKWRPATSSRRCGRVSACRRQSRRRRSRAREKRSRARIGHASDWRAARNSARSSERYAGSSEEGARVGGMARRAKLAHGFMREYE